MGGNDVFKVADRRASHDEDAPSPQQKPAAPEPQETPESLEKPGNALPENSPILGEEGENASENQGEEMGEGVSLISLKIPEMANFMVGLLLQKTYISLGLMPHPETGKPCRDLGEATLAIDLAAAISEQMKGKWGVIGFEKELQTQITNLRIQFAKLSSAK